MYFYITGYCLTDFFLFHFRDSYYRIEVLDRPDGLGLMEIPGAEVLPGEGLAALKKDMEMWNHESKRNDLLLVAICTLPEHNTSQKRKSICKTVGFGATWLVVPKDYEGLLAPLVNETRVILKTSPVAPVPSTDSGLIPNKIILIPRRPGEVTKA